MSTERGIKELLPSTIIRQVFDALSGEPGFEGADFGAEWQNGRRIGTDALRIHTGPGFSSASRKAAKTAARRLGCSDPVFLRSEYDACPRTNPVCHETRYLTSGDGCSSVKGGGQITLLTAGRETGRISFLTSWAAGARGARMGAPVFKRPNPLVGERPIGYLSDVQMDQFGSAALVEPIEHTDWLPVVRPDNQIITALKPARLGEVYDVGSGAATVDGIGRYRIEHLLADGSVKKIEMDGIRLSVSKPVGSGALVHEKQTRSGVGMVCAFSKNSGQGVAIACNLPRVFATLGLRLATYDDLFLEGKPKRPVQSQQPTTVLNDPRDTAHCIKSLAVHGLGDNNRLDVATVIWPRVKSAVQAATGNPCRLADRIEILSPLGNAPSILAKIINEAAPTWGIGLKTMPSTRFVGIESFGQLCEVINDYMEEGDAG